MRRRRSMAVRLIVTFTALPGKGADLAAAFTSVAKEVQREQGCEQYEMFVGAQSPDQVVLLERWTTAADLDVHAEAMRARGPSPTAPFRADVPPTVERFEV
jgi:quinol monooxygenase YgiN